MPQLTVFPSLQYVDLRKEQCRICNRLEDGPGIGTDLDGCVNHPEMTVSSRNLVSMISVPGAAGATKKMEPKPGEILNAVIEKMKVFQN